MALSQKGCKIGEREKLEARRRPASEGRQVRVGQGRRTELGLMLCYDLNSDICFMCFRGFESLGKVNAVHFTDVPHFLQFFTLHHFVKTAGFPG